MKTLLQLAGLVKGTVIGNGDTVIDKVGSVLHGAISGSITFIETEKLLEKAEQTGAAAIIAPRSLSKSSKPLLVVDNPKLAFAIISGLFYQKPLSTHSIDSRSAIHTSAVICSRVSVHPFAVISENTFIEEDSIIGPGTFIGKNVRIGRNCEIRSNVVIEHDTIIGNNVTIHGGSVIGADGFGFVSTTELLHKVPQLGNVIIEDDVEIFANATIDRGTVGPTTIGRGSKLGDQVHIGHNVEIGPECILVAQVVVGGSTTLGRRVIAAGKVGISDHVHIGDNTVLTADTTVFKSIKENSFCSGSPATDHKKDYRIKAASRKLPELIKQVSKLEKKIAELEKKLIDKT